MSCVESAAKMQWYLVNAGDERFLFLLVAILRHDHLESVDAQLAVELQRLLHRLLSLECHPHCTPQIIIYLSLFTIKVALVYTATAPHEGTQWDGINQ